MSLSFHGPTGPSWHAFRARPRVLSFGLKLGASSRPQRSMRAPERRCECVTAALVHSRTRTRARRSAYSPESCIPPWRPTAPAVRLTSNRSLAPLPRRRPPARPRVAAVHGALAELPRLVPLAPLQRRAHTHSNPPMDTGHRLRVIRHRPGPRHGHGRLAGTDPRPWGAGRSGVCVVSQRSALSVWGGGARDERPGPRLRGLTVPSPPIRVPA